MSNVDNFISYKELTDAEIKSCLSELENVTREKKREIQLLKNTLKERKKDELKVYIGKCYAIRECNAPADSEPVRYSKVINYPVEQYEKDEYNEEFFCYDALPTFSFWVTEPKDILKINSHFKDADGVDYGLCSPPDYAPVRCINGSGDGYYDGFNYTEITPEEFNSALEKHLKCIYKAVVELTK